MITKPYFQNEKEKLDTLKTLQDLSDVINSGSHDNYRVWLAKYENSGVHPFKAIQNACQCVMGTDVAK